MYGLMFRSERLDMRGPRCMRPPKASFEGLARGVGAGRQEQMSGGARSAVARAGRRNRGRLVTGARLHDAAA